MTLRNMDMLEESNVQDNTHIQTASTRNQTITISTSDVTVTCPNPHIVRNNQADAATISIKLVGETTFTDYYFLGGQSEVMTPSEIGGTDNTNSDDGTVLIIRGIE